MAGTLVIDTLNAGSGVLASQNGMTGIAKAWVAFTGLGGASISGSFNVSSVVYNGTGSYTIYFTTAMPNTNYSIVSANAGNPYSGDLCFLSAPCGTGTFTYQAPSTGSFNIMGWGRTTGQQDLSYVGLAVYS